MKRYVEVFWTPHFFEEYRGAFAVLAQPPKPLFPVLQDLRPNAKYLKCPAIADSCKNEFVVLCPFDLVVTINKENKEITTDRFGQEFYDKNIRNRMGETDPQNPALLTLPIRYTFYSKDSVELETADLPIITSRSSENFKVIRGGFNIGKWVRPIELAVEVVDHTKPITLYADDPLFLLKFKTPNNVPIKLTRVDSTQELARVTQACTGLKQFRPNLKLSKLYELAENYLEVFKRGK